MLFSLLTIAALALSTFNGLACLWLAVSVALLNLRPASEPPPGVRPSRTAAVLAVCLLALSALFFLAHAALIGRGVLLGGVGASFWWRVAWVPVVLVPYLWYALSVVYSGHAALRIHRGPLAAMGVFAALLLLFAQLGGLPSYDQALGYEELPRGTGSGLVPLVVWLYLPLLLLCAMLPIDALLRGLRVPGPRGDARRRARPALIVASLLLVMAGTLAAVAVLGVWQRAPALPSLNTLMLIDATINGLIAVATLVVGSAVVSYEVFTGGALPRRGFLQRWVGTVAVLLASALLTAGLTFLEMRPIYGLLCATAVATVAYALLGWQNDLLRAAFMQRLRPFVAGVLPRHSPLHPSSETWQPLFIALCDDILATQRACLIRRTPGGAEVALRYGWLEDPPDAHQVLLALNDRAARALVDARAFGASWALPLGGALPEGALLFESRGYTSVYSEEEIELAQACCERLLDALAGAQLTAVAVGLLRQRIAEVKVLSARQRRTLHDEVMPGIHAALIHLGGARAADGTLRLAPENADVVIASLSDTHRRLADLIRAIPSASPHRLEQDGLAAALQTMLQRDFGDAFEHTCWQADALAVAWSGALAPFAAEVLFYAAQEAVRNAARHGRGAAGERVLRLEVALRWQVGLQLEVADDGVGIGAGGSAQGSGSGLRFHEAMLAVIGGRLAVEPRASGGTRVTISLEDNTAASLGEEETKRPRDQESRSLLVS